MIEMAMVTLHDQHCIMKIIVTGIRGNICIFISAGAGFERIEFSLPLL
jgi:hypothetical protein